MTVITAHSGCDKTPENSLRYIRHALSCPFDVIEIDIRRRKDGALVLSHNDDNLNKKVLLGDAFKRISKSPIYVNCDLKENGLEDDVIRIANENGLELYRLIFTGSVTEPETFMKRYKDIKVFINPEVLIDDFYTRVTRKKEDLLVNKALEYGFKVLNVNYRMCDEKFFKMCDKAGIQISAWTVDDRDTFDSLRKQGILNITTNHSEFILPLIY